MAEQSETAKVLDELAQKNTAKPRGKAGVKANKQKLNSSLFATLLMGFVVLAALAILAYQQRSITTEFASLRIENQRLEQLLASRTQETQDIEQRIQQAVGQASEALANDESALLEISAEMAEEIARLENEIQALVSIEQADTATPDFQWKVYEAEYLLGIANQKLQLESDVAAAIAMMEAADAALLASGSSRVFGVRQAIANELTRLRTVTFFDRAGVYLEIGALIQEVENIDIVNSMRENFEASLVAGDSPQTRPATDSQDIFGESLEFLRSVFVWRQWDETPNATLAPEQSEFIRQNLKLMLEQSQLALLMKDQAVFTESLNKSREWLDRYAVVDSSSVELITNSLANLSEINVDPVLPGINESLTLIRQLTATER